MNRNVSVALSSVWVLAFSFVTAVTCEAQTPTATVYVNHVYVTPDDSTFAAIRNNAFLRQQFGAMEERTTVRTDSTYHGLYFYGQNTYFEITQVRKGSPEGTTGVGFSVDNASELPLLQAQFSKTLSQPGKSGPVTRESSDGKQVPWFTILSVPYDAGKKADFFVLSYDPRFLAQWYPNYPPAGGGTTRNAILERYVAKIGQVKTRANGLIEDVEEVDFSGSTPAKLCTALNAQMSSGYSGTASCGMNGVALNFSGKGTLHVCSVRFRLKKDAQEQTLTLGTSTLHLARREATWNFCGATGG